jgi:Rod binding domain-containing protein
VDSALPQVGAQALAGMQGERALAAARAASAQGDGAHAARDFERLLATQLVKELRRGLPEGFFGSEAGSDVFEGWFDENLGDALCDGRGLGLRFALERELGPRAAGDQPPSAEGKLDRAQDKPSPASEVMP